MGYYTDFTITVARHNGHYSEDDINAALDACYSGLYLNSTYNAKWYDHEKDMTAISKAFPNVMFQVDGIGEEAGDIWRQYFCNGYSESSQATLVFPSLDLDAIFKHAAKEKPVTKAEYEAARKALASATSVIERYKKVIPDGE